ncbi:MAG: hypothetical protein Q8R16_03935 [bacterium]|nr:hypothetical protein [bacterium]
MDWKKVLGLVATIAIIGMIIVGGARWWSKRTPDTSDASRLSRTGGAQLPGDHPATPQNIELTQACDALASSAPGDVVKHWVAAHRATRNALEREVWIRDRFAWMDLHKVETTLATCGIRGPRALEIIAAIARDEDYGRFVREEREAICASSQKFATATSGAAVWREDAMVLWNAACVRLLSGPVTGGSATGVVHEALPSTPAASPTGSCTGLDTLSTQHAEMASRSLEASAWIAYGRTLTACGPETNPWEALHLERGREQFIDDYVVPFINGDVTQGSPFQKQAADLHDRIVTAWGLNEG